MRSARPLPLHPSIAAVFAAAVIALPAFARPPVAAAPSLLTGLNRPVADELPAAIRSRTVSIDAAAMDVLATGHPIELNLFDDASFTASLHTMAQAGAWHGSIEGAFSGWVTLVRHGDLVAASIRVPGEGTFRIRPVAGGLHVVEQIDEEAQLPCGFGGEQAVRIENAADPGFGGGVAAGGGGPTVIDVMVVYTPIARSAAGGTAAIETLIDLFVADTNDAYQNSLIDMQINLVYAGEIDYDESGDHLGSLTDLNDGIMDEVNGLRYAYQADLVNLLVNSAGYCGIAWLMPSNSVSSEYLGYSVVVWPCGGLVFAHELGHNMGCCHAPGDGGGCTTGGLYPYSVGYRYNGQSGTLWRTVMAYSPGTRIPNFSNPNVLVDNEPTGVPFNQPDAAENALTINQTAGTIAQYRTGLPFCETQKYLAQDGNGSDFFGFTATIDGDTALVGASLDDEGAPFAGSVYVYQYDAGLDTWNEQQKLLASDPVQSGSFGSALGLDGAVAVIGAPGMEAAYVYRYDDNLLQWIQEQKLTASDGQVGDYFGTSVAISGDVIVVGAFGCDDVATDAGAAYVYRYDGGGGQWQEETKLLPFDGTADLQMGQAAASKADTVIVGGTSPEPGGGGGAAYVFRFDGSTWSDDGKIEPVPANDDAEFGSSMAISGDELIVGASAHTGAAFVFREIGGAWVQEGALTPSDGSNNDFFGTSVDISGDVAIVGSPFDDDFGSGSGSAYLYRYDGVDWTELGKMMPVDSVQFDFVGYSVAIEGIRSIVGAAGDSSLGGSAGAFHAFNGFVGTDCNGNGTADECEILAGDVTDANGNGVPDECDLPGDIDGNGTVGINDLLLLLAAWGPCADCGACPADLDGDCQVGINDFLMLLSAWTT